MLWEQTLAFLRRQFEQAVETFLVEGRDTGSLTGAAGAKIRGFLSEVIDWMLHYS